MKEIYGILPQYPMKDPTLTRRAKLAYALLCTYRSLKEIYPTIKTLSRQMGCGHRQVRAALRLLEAQGYVKITPHGRKSNLYEIIEYPEKFKREPTDDEAAYAFDYAKIQQAGSLSGAGFGKITRAIFEDANVPCGSKIVFAVRSAFVNLKDKIGRMFLAGDIILSFCQMCEKTYRKYSRILEESGYLHTVQRICDGRFSINDCYISVAADASTASAQAPQKEISVGYSGGESGKSNSFVSCRIVAFTKAVNYIRDAAGRFAKRVLDAVCGATDNLAKLAAEHAASAATVAEAKRDMLYSRAESTSDFDVFDVFPADFAYS